MLTQTTLLVIEPATARLLIEALEHGNKDSPVSWVMLATYAELYFSEDAATRTRVIELMDDLVTLGVPVTSTSNRKQGLGYFILRTPNELREAVSVSDDYTAERLNSINLATWFNDVKKQLQMLELNTRNCL